MQDLELLAPDQAGSVVMVAPIERFTTLWADLRRRCRLAGLPVHGDHAAGSPVRWTRIGAAQALLLVSWGALLAGVRASVMAGRDAPLTQEIDQLANFCERLDADAFPPLATAELAALTPRRLGQLLDILDDVAMACEQRGIGQHVGVDARASRGAFCRSLRVGHFEFALIWSVPLWATQRETPFWLQITPATAAPATPIEEQLLTLSYELPPRLLRDPSHGQPLVPLFPLTGVGRAAVVADLVVQVEAVARLLDEAPTIGFGSATVRST
jgi:hypothetical protein